MKIKSIRSIGFRQTYSPEMKSASHNYVTNESRAVHRNSHSVSYCLVAFRCLWLKAHFAPEYWAAVMSDCHPDKLVRYMNVARSEEWQPTDITYSGRTPSAESYGVQFGTLNINNLTVNYTVTDNTVNQGLIGIKKIGEKAAEVFAGKGNWSDIDEFIGSSEGRKNKTVIERFIKLGAFASMVGHENSKALWHWYQYKYCSDTAVRNEIKDKLLELEGWNDKTIKEERQRQINEYKRQYPNRRKVPPKFNNWLPKPNDSRDRVMALYKDDFTQGEKLEFQKEFLGYYLDSPLELFAIKGHNTIRDAKQTCIEDDNAYMEVMVTDQAFLMTKPKDGREGTQYLKLTVTDGIQSALVFIWNTELSKIDPDMLVEGAGIRLRVKYDQQRNTFSMYRGSSIIALRKRG